MVTRTPLLPLVQKFFETDAVAAAHSLETMDESEALSVLMALPPSLSAQAFRYLPVRQAGAFLKEVPPDLFKQIVERLDAQQGAAILLNLPDHIRKDFVDYLSEKKKREIQELLAYPKDTAGRLMTTEFLDFHTEVRVKEAIQKIRSLAHRKALVSYAYVVDMENRLVGVINMRDLMLAPPDATLESIMRKDVFAVNCFLDREEVANELSKRRFFAAPVVDPEHRLLGVVKTDQLIEHVQAEATEDLQKMFGAGGDERAFSPVGFSLRKRLPWLYVNLATAFLAAAVVALFEGIIAKITVLAVFLPVVAGQGGNAGAQSLAVVMRGLIMREIPRERVRRLLVKETLIGAVNGVLIGVVTAAIAWTWHGNPFLGVVIGLGMIVNLVAAGFSGAAIPITMKAVGLDPAQSSSIILTTVTDVIGFFAFLGFAVVFQSYLM
jgi:magnesium transporter